MTIDYPRFQFLTFISWRIFRPVTSSRTKKKNWIFTSRVFLHNCTWINTRARKLVSIPEVHRAELYEILLTSSPRVTPIETYVQFRAKRKRERERKRWRTVSLTHCVSSTHSQFANVINTRASLTRHHEPRESNDLKRKENSVFFFYIKATWSSKIYALCLALTDSLFEIFEAKSQRSTSDIVIISINQKGFEINKVDDIYHWRINP